MIIWQNRNIPFFLSMVITRTLKNSILFPVDQWHGGRVQFIRSNVIHLMRGEIYDIDGKKIFCFGGGYSLDKDYRVPGRTWVVCRRCLTMENIGMQQRIWKSVDLRLIIS